jgi:LysR family pca operon transcriptional activator
MESSRLRQIKMRHLSAFTEVVRLGSLKSAAERLFVTQSSISKTLKDLETILDVSLLRRDRGGVELTREGAVFQQFSEQSLAAVSHGLASLDALTDGAAAPLRIGALPSVAADLLPDVILSFSKLSPASRVTVEDGRISTLVERLRSAELDFVIGRMGRPETMNGLSFRQLYSEQVVFAVRPDHPLAKCSDPSALSDFTVLYPPKGAAIRPLVDRFMIAHGIGELPSRLETVSGAFGRAMTLGEGRAVWIISQGVIAGDIAGGHMAVLPIDTSEMAGPVGVMTRAEENPAPQMRLFLQALLERLAIEQAAGNGQKL